MEQKKTRVDRVIRGGLAAALAVVLPASVAWAAEAETGTWFDPLEPGVCFDDAFLASGDFDYSVPPAIVSCDEPHDNEVVARVPLGDVERSHEELVPIVDAACEVEYEAFLGRPIGTTLMFPFSVAPESADWAAGIDYGLCSVYAGEKVLGTSTSGSLRAPGESLAVYREVDGDPDIWLIDAGTGEPVRNVSDNELAEVITSPAWSPDGSSIAFAAKVDPTGDDSDIYLASADGAGAEMLFDSADLDEGAAFSPDGSAIVYFSDTGAVEYDIFVRDLAADESTRLTTHLDRDSSPQWSPDGSSIAFRRRTDGVSSLWLMDADGSNQRQLTNDEGNDYDPRWSPDGSRIAFTTDRNGNFDIGVMDSDGSDAFLLTTHPADDEYPSWSRDGSILAFHSSRHGGVSLWLMRADGSDQSELTGLAPVGFPAFAPAAGEQ